MRALAHREGVSRNLHDVAMQGLGNVGQGKGKAVLGKEPAKRWRDGEHPRIHKRRILGAPEVVRAVLRREVELERLGRHLIVIEPGADVAGRESRGGVR